MNITDNQKAHIGLIITNFFFGINFSAVKYLNNKNLITAFGLNFTRVLVATLLFWLLLIGKKQSWKIQQKHIPLFVFCALMGVVLNQILFIKGLTLTNTTHASLLILITPILVSIGAVIYHKEKMQKQKWVGLLLGLCGALVLVASREVKQSSAAQNIVLGDMLVIVNAICYTIYFIAVKPLMNHYNPLHVLRWIFTIGLFMMAPITFSDFKTIPWSNYTTIDYGILSCIVIGATFLSYLLNVYGIKILGASIAGNYIYTQPIYALSIAIIWLGENLTWYKIIAAALIILGVFFASKK